MVQEPLSAAPSHCGLHTRAVALSCPSQTRGKEGDQRTPSGPARSTCMGSLVRVLPGAVVR